MCDLILLVKYFTHPSIEITTLVFKLNPLFHFWRPHVQDLAIKPKYLVTFTVGIDQKKNIDAAVKKVS